MNKKTTDIVAYLTWIGLVIALVAGDKENSRFHLNQALVIMLFSLLSIIPCIGLFWAIFMIVCWFIGFISAINEEEKPVPVIGKITLIKPKTDNNIVQNDENKTDL